MPARNVTASACCVNDNTAPVVTQSNPGCRYGAARLVCGMLSSHFVSRVFQFIVNILLRRRDERWTWTICPTVAPTCSRSNSPERLVAAKIITKSARRWISSEGFDRERLFAVLRAAESLCSTCEGLAPERPLLAVARSSLSSRDVVRTAFGLYAKSPRRGFHPMPR